MKIAGDSLMRFALLIAAAGASLSLAEAPLAAQDPLVVAEADAQAEAAADEQVDPASAGAPADEFVFLSEEEEERAKLEKEMTEAFGLFADIFKADPLTAEQEARVPLGTDMARLMMPDGSFGTAMQASFEPMMTVIMDEVSSDPRVRLAEVSGVDAEHLAALSDQAAQDALDIFDPNHAAREQRLADMMMSMIGKLLIELEPAYRDALARALAVRFEEGEMRELLAFFATPVGGKFAQQSFLVQYDPRMMGVMEAMGPALVKIMPELEEESTAIEVDLGTARDFTELSAAERLRAARLIGKSASELDALVPEITEDEGEAEQPVA